MSSNRDKAVDAATTRSVLAGDRPPESDGKNWIGHTVGSGAAKIDLMLLEGATKEQMQEARYSTDEHIHHLRTEHGLDVTQIGDVYRFVSDHLEPMATDNDA